jgi:hypothetical protein
VHIHSIIDGHDESSEVTIDLAFVRRQIVDG